MQVLLKMTEFCTPVRNRCVRSIVGETVTVPPSPYLQTLGYGTGKAAINTNLLLKIIHRISIKTSGKQCYCGDYCTTITLGFQ